MSERRIPIARLLWSAAVSFFVLALLIGLVARPGGDFSPARLFEVLRRLAPAVVGAYLACQLFQAWLRAMRYRLLLRAGGETVVPPLRQVGWVTLARNMFVDLLPARAGELSYLAMLNRGYRVGAEACLSSMAVSLLLDFAALLLVLVAALAGLAHRGSLAGAVVVLVAVVAVGGWALFSGAGWSARFVRRAWPRLAAWRPADRAIAFVERFDATMRAVRRSGALGRALALSAGIRAAKYAGLYLLFAGVARAGWPALAGANPLAVLVALIAAEGAASLPVPSFMSFGTYEFGGAAALMALGFGREDSAMAMLAMHVASQAVDYALGGLGLLGFALGVPGRAARPAAAVAARRPARLRAAAGAAAATAAIAAVALAAWQGRNLKKLGATAPPPPGREAGEDAAGRAAFAAAAGGIRGRLAWSSNRHGNHDILLMELPGLAVRRLTEHPHVETFPRFSPDGRRVLFCRSQVPWVSQRDPVPWDAYVADLADGRETLVARDAYMPTWSEDGASVGFQRHGTQFVVRALSGGGERVLFEAGRDGIPAGVQLQTPEMNARDGRLAVTYRGAKRATMVLGPDGAARRVSGGCQLAWSPDREFLYYVDRGGRMQNLVYRADPATLESRPWLDLPEPFSHEYFPRVSNDGRWLVLGAAAEGHEHDTADYEIFLWRIGDPPAAAVRATWHTGNDNWPDLWVSPGGAPGRPPLGFSFAP